MTPLEHYFFLPPILIAIHGLLLLPVFVLPWPDGFNLPPSSERESALNLRNAILFGIAGFVGVLVAKQLAVRIPLPKSSERRHLTERLEWGILFMLGFLEEVWRWGIVRMLLHLEDKGDGFEGDILSGIGFVRSVHRGNFSLGDGLWKELYLMGWVWCFIESGFAWWSFSPRPKEELSGRQHDHHHHRRERSIHRRRDRDRESSPEDSDTQRPSHGQGISPSVALVGNANPFSFRTPIWDQVNGAGIGSRVSLVSQQQAPRIEVQAPRSEQPVRQTFAPQFTFGTQSGFLAQTRGGVSYAQHDLFGSPTEDHDLERGSRSHHSDYDSDDDYCSSAEGSSARSSSESARSRSQTPLLSSSLPYDPMSEHPHHEQQALLNQYRRMSYHTLGHSDSGYTDGREEAIVVRDYDSDMSEDEGPCSLRPRAYPSYPSYSVSYNHAYFAANPTNPVNLETTATPFLASSASPLLGSPSSHYQQQQQVQYDGGNRQHRTGHGSERTTTTTTTTTRTTYGVDPNSLAMYLPVLWRASAVLRGLGHVLIFAWFPNLIHRHDLQLWTLMVLMFLGTWKGLYTIEWVGGHAAKFGMPKISVVTTVVSLVTYLVGLALWGVTH